MAPRKLYLKNFLQFALFPRNDGTFFFGKEEVLEKKGASNLREGSYGSKGIARERERGRVTGRPGRCDGGPQTARFYEMLMGFSRF